jgi:hypothetical protein
MINDFGTVGGLKISRGNRSTQRKRIDREKVHLIRLLDRWWPLAWRVERSQLLNSPVPDYRNLPE